MNAADIPGVALRPAMENLARMPAYVCAALDAASLAREGDFDGRRITLADLVAMVVDHDREHRNEIEALLAALELRPWK